MLDSSPEASIFLFSNDSLAWGVRPKTEKNWQEHCAMRREQCDIISTDLFSRGREEKRPWKQGLRLACSQVVLA